MAFSKGFRGKVGVMSSPAGKVHSRGSESVRECSESSSGPDRDRPSQLESTYADYHPPLPRHDVKVSLIDYTLPAR